MALGLLLILFVSMSVISGLGILFLYLAKNERVKKYIFYFLCMWGMLIAAMSATSLPTNYVGRQMISWAIGLLSVIALILYIKSKAKTEYQIAYVLVTVSVVGNMLSLFVF